ncbi:glutamate--cysteine ligase [Streptomyces sp. NPDC026673]|uniref:glutamate--cysteine ligase 2 n=1 Tax=Streptomyces sp. NPDC026673 TaxID=3155724 RepID=UPI0034102B11
MRSVGVEEELLLLDADSDQPRALSSAVLHSARRDSATPAKVFEAELQRQQVEFATRPQTRMQDLADEIVRWRAEAARHAAKVGATVAALATSPLPVSPTLSTGARYLWMRKRYGLTADEQLTCGCHVHVSVESDEEGVAILDRIRQWLAVLLAMSANSPFWQGRDSGYASYRNRVWGRWPSSGPVEVFGSAAQYHQLVRTMVATGALRDEGMIYFDARLSRTYPTVEVRVADVCLDPAVSALIATMVRALAETAAREWRAGEPPADCNVALLRLSAWRAAREGLDGQLIHPATMEPAPAETVVHAMLDHVRNALEDNGDLIPAQYALAELLKTGTGARIQREVLAEWTGSLREMVAECVRRTQGT